MLQHAWPAATLAAQAAARLSLSIVLQHGRLEVASWKQVHARCDCDKQPVRQCAVAADDGPDVISITHDHGVSAASPAEQDDNLDGRNIDCFTDYRFAMPVLAAPARWKGVRRVLEGDALARNSICPGSTSTPP